MCKNYLYTGWLTQLVNSTWRRLGTRGRVPSTVRCYLFVWVPTAYSNIIHKTTNDGGDPEMGKQNVK